MTRPIERHRLSVSDFDELAAGLGDGAVVRRLRATQVSRQLLRLRAVLDSAHERGLHQTTGLRSGFELLSAVHDRHPSIVAEVLTRPSVGVWAALCLRDPVPRRLGWLAAIGAAAAIAAGETFAIELPLQDGVVALPGLGRMVDLSHQAAKAGAVTVSGVDGIASISIGSEQPIRILDHGNDVPDAQNWQAIRRIVCVAGEMRLTVGLDDVDPYRDGHGLDTAGRLDERALRRWTRTLREAWTLIVRDHGGYAAALAAGLHTIVPLRAPRQNRGMSSTSADAFGSLALTAPGDPVTAAVTLLHEFQHGKLNALLDLVSLHVAPENGYYAPWRDDPRPLGGLLHGAYAHLAVTDFWRVHRSVAGERAADYAHLQFARWRRCTVTAIETIAGSGALTGPGQRFVAGMRERILRWSDEPVPQPVATLADESTTDHLVGWRLRNLRPDPAGIERLVAAWRSGRPCPSVDVRVGEPIRSERALENNPRLDLLYLRLRDRDRFDLLNDDIRALRALGIDASEADTAYAQGDLARAKQRYGTQIHATPDSARAWAGYAMACRPAAGAPSGAWRGAGLRRRPELVYAVYQRLRCAHGTAPEPDALSEWLAPALG